MTAALDVPKNDPADVAKGLVVALVNGDSEYLADDASRYAKSLLTGDPKTLVIV